MLMAFVFVIMGILFVGMSVGIGYDLWKYRKRNVADPDDEEF